MLFNSYIYILAFLPVTLLGYYLLAGQSDRMSRIWLVAASLIFYGYWVPAYLTLILVSMSGNYILATSIMRLREGKGGAGSRILPCIGLVFNLGLLGYYKYADFFINNVNASLGLQVPLLRLVLPLAISFFTFQQIAYILDVHKGKARSYGFLNFALFVTFSPS